jgi:cytochrome c-type biogenesis protein CcmH
VIGCAWRGLLLAVLLAAGAGFVPTASAQAPSTSDAPLTFTSAAEEQRFHALVAELRCVMCQNQSLADSNAMIARDLRREVLDLMRQGKSNAQIKQFLVERYGQFVLYRPQVRTGTWLLWFGPALVLLIGGIVVARVVRQRAAAAAPAANDDDSQEW